MTELDEVPAISAEDRRRAVPEPAGVGGIGISVGPRSALVMGVSG